MYKEYIKCPKCLKDNDLESLESNTEYSCWSGESVYVNCLHCEYGFDVSCEHRGYEPLYDSFDMNAFMMVNKVTVPENISVIFVRHYFKDFIFDGSTSLVISDTYKEGNLKWAEAYDFAAKEWGRIQSEKR